MFLTTSVRDNFKKITTNQGMKTSWIILHEILTFDGSVAAAGEA